MTRTTAALIASPLVASVLIIGVCASWYAVRTREVEEAKVFCESLARRIELTRSSNSCLPETFDPAWVAGLEVPRLARRGDLYARATCERFGLSFDDPTQFWDNTWAYHLSADGGGSWIQYDSD